MISARGRLQKNIANAAPPPLARSDGRRHEMQVQLTGMIALGLMFVMLAVAVVTDLRTGKVRNWLTAPAALVGLGLGAIGGGLPALGDRVLGVVLVLVVVSLLARTAHLGGGDIKLLAAVAALQGFHFAVWTLLLTGVLGGGLAIVVMLRRRATRVTMANLVTGMVANAGGVPIDLTLGSAGGRIPYSIAIALGALSTLALGALGR